MSLFPIYADVAGRPVLVVGGGQVALRKVGALLEAGAQVVVGAPRHLPKLQQLEREGRLQLRLGEFQPGWLDGMWLVVAATSDRAVNGRVAEAAEARRIWCNVVDDPELSSFQVPAVVNRAPVMIAVSSSGAAPVLARCMRERIEALFDHSVGELAQLAAKYRDAIRNRYADLGQRRRFYDWLFDGPVASLVQHGRTGEAETVLQAALKSEPVVHGRIIFMGAGPGRAAFLTLQGLRALNEADLIVHQDVPAEILAMARRDAVVQGWQSSETGDTLLQHLAAEASRGRCVVHVRCGAPYQPEGMDAFRASLAGHVDVEIVRGLPPA